MASRMLYRSVLLIRAPRSPAPIANDGHALFEFTEADWTSEVRISGVFGHKCTPCCLPTPSLQDQLVHRCTRQSTVIPPHTSRASCWPALRLLRSGSSHLCVRGSGQVAFRFSLLRGPR